MILMHNCNNFYENDGEDDATVTVIIENDGNNDPLIIDLQPGGHEVTRIPKGQTKTIRVKIPRGSSLHCDGDGKYLPLGALGPETSRGALEYFATQVIGMAEQLRQSVSKI